jgi:hypothetical protein
VVAGGLLRPGAAYVTADGGRALIDRELHLPRRGRMTGAAAGKPGSVAR